MPESGNSLNESRQRWDWEVTAECPNNGEAHPPEVLEDDDEKEHISVEADATNSEWTAAEALDGIGDPDDPMECMICGTPLDVEVDERPTEALDA